MCFISVFCFVIGYDLSLYDLLFLFVKNIEMVVDWGSVVWVFWKKDNEFDEYEKSNGIFDYFRLELVYVFEL